VVSYNGVDGVSNPHFTSCSLSLFGKVVYILDNGVTISRSKLSITLLEATIKDRRNSRSRKHPEIDNKNF